MSRVSHIQTNFTAGEISPRLYGRVDLAKYQNGTAQCRNMVIMPHGGLTRRPGTRFVQEAKDSMKVCILVPFEFSTTQAYVLEFGHLYMRVYKDNGIVLTTGSAIYEVVTPYTEADLPTLRWAQNADTLFLVHGSHAPRLLTRTAHDAWTLTTLDYIEPPYLDENTDTTKTIAPSGTGQYVVNGNFDDSISNWTNKSAGSVSKIMWDSGGYCLLIADGSNYAWAQQAVTLPASGVEYTLEFEIRTGPVLVRLGTSDGGAEVLAETSYEKGVQTIKFTPGATTVYLGFRHLANASRSIDSVRISRAVSVTLTANWPVFTAGHVGAFFRVRHGAYIGVAKITAVTDATHATATVVEPFSSTAASAYWRESMWSQAQGWPQVVTFHQQRLVFGATTQNPQTLWMSRTSKYNDFAPDTTADAPINVTMASNSMNAITAVTSARTLVINTTGGEWRIGSQDSDTPVTPSTCYAKEETTYGSAPGLPTVKVGGVTLFVQRSGRKVRELVYDYQTAGWVGADLTMLSEHITAGGIKSMSYAAEPDSILWSVRGDGKLLGLTYNRVEQVIGWHWHDTDGEFESVACIRRADIDQVWVVVRRTIGGVAKRYIEYFEAPFDAQAREDACFLDCSLAYSGTAATSFSGLAHLEGKVVDILADGSVRAPKTVASGAVTITKAATKATIGLPYTSEVQTLRIEAGGDDGTAQGKVKRIPYVTLRVHRSLGYEVAYSQDKYFRPPHRSSATPLGQAPELFSGDERVALDARYDTAGQVWVRQIQPYPLTLLAIVATMQVNQ